MPDDRNIGATVPPATHGARVATAAGAADPADGGTMARAAGAADPHSSRAGAATDESADPSTRSSRPRATCSKTPSTADGASGTARAADGSAARAGALEALKDQLSELLAAQRRLRGRDAGQRRGGLSFAQYRLVRELARAPGGELAASQLATAAELSPPTVTQMLDQLAACGIVERTRSERDRRVVTNRLTEEGRRRLAAKDADHAEKWREAFAALDRDQLLAGVAVLERLAALYDDL